MLLLLLLLHGTSQLGLLTHSLTSKSIVGQSNRKQSTTCHWYCLPGRKHPTAATATAETPCSNCVPQIDCTDWLRCYAISISRYAVLQYSALLNNTIGCRGNKTINRLHSPTRLLQGWPVSWWFDNHILLTRNSGCKHAQNTVWVAMSNSIRIWVYILLHFMGQCLW